MSVEHVSVLTVTSHYGEKLVGVTCPPGSAGVLEFETDEDEAEYMRMFGEIPCVFIDTDSPVHLTDIHEVRALATWFMAAAMWLEDYGK